MITMNVRCAASSALALLLVFAVGCAARASGGSVSSPTSGSAAPSTEEPAPATDFNASDPGVLEREIRRVMRSSLPAAEAWDGRLAMALDDLAVSPTPRQHLEVAAEYRRLGIFDDALKHLTMALSFPTSAAPRTKRSPGSGVMPVIPAWQSDTHIGPSLIRRLRPHTTRSAPC
jgi:hypothetical protein